jgi:outer membrane protein OmpA-like peptidoglycan-associated protein
VIAMRAFSLAVAFALSFAFAACAPPPRPAVLDEADRTRTTAAAREAAELAPQAFLSAENLRKEAARAYDEGDRARAEALAEQAVAAYLHASVLARLAKADDRLTRTAARSAEVVREVSALEEQQRRVAAEADDAELRFRVLRDALPVVPPAPANAERETARLASARALALEARLLCVATQMLGADRPGVTAAFQALDALDAELDKRPARPPLDAAVRLRSTCLSELTSVRRTAAAAAGAADSGAADALLDELGRATFEPRRDDRGVSVTFRDGFRGSTLTPAARDRLTALGQVARAHPTFPILVVVHGGRGAAARDAERAGAVQTALKEAGAPRVEARAGGNALPVVPLSRADSAARNERVEIVFVAPST